MYSQTVTRILEPYQKLSVTQLVKHGAGPALGKQIHRLAGIYFGTTTATTKQKTCRDAAIGNRHNLETLDLIESYIRKLKDKNKAWQIDGLDIWVPAFGGVPKLNMHPCAQGGAIRLAKKMVGRENA